VSNNFWGIYVASVFMIFVSAALIALWGYATYVTIEQVGDSAGARYGVCCFLLLSLYWIVNVKRYVVHCTAAGAFGTWYFQVAEGDPNSASIAGSGQSFKRAITTSFGSICYGALIISLIELMEAMARSMRESENGIAKFVGCCLECILACIRDMVEYLNSYAYTIVAIFGDDYCTAVNKTMAVFGGNGWDMLINDCLVEDVLCLGAFACGLVGAGAGVGVTFLDDSSTKYTSDQETTQRIIVGVAGFFIGWGMMAIVNATIVSCVKSFYVCMALDPLVLYNTKRSIYDKITAAWQRRWPEGIPCRAYLDRAMVGRAPAEYNPSSTQYAPPPGNQARYAGGVVPPAPAPSTTTWQTHVDASSGHTYHYNPATGETRWANQ